MQFFRVYIILHQQILSDFLSLVNDANKRTKLIELKYLDETKKVVDGYFTQAIRIVEGKDKPIAQPAMNTILSRCHYRGDVLAEKGKFYYIFNILCMGNTVFVTRVLRISFCGTYH